MKLKKNLSIFLTAFSFFVFTIGITACSDDTPEIDKPGEENPDNGNGDDSDKEENYISELDLVSFDKKTDDNESQVTVKYALDEHISEAKLAISSSQSNDATIEGLINGSIEGYSIYGDGELTLPFDNSNPAGSYSVVMSTFIESEYYNDYHVDFYWDGETADIPSSDDLEDNTVVVYYNEEEATVVAASNIAEYVSATISGAQVSLTQSGDVNDAIGEITYILNGGSSNGSFTLEGSYKSTVMLNGLSLTNKSGAAIDIQNGKRIKVKLADGTFNSLTDSSDGNQKASLYCKGHLEFSGSGSLNVVGNTAHAISAKEYIEIKKSEITVTKAVKDGINCNQYFLMESGTVNISGTGDDGIQVSYKDDTDREAEDTGTLTINGGSLNISVTADAAKALKADNDIIIAGGTINANVSGNGIWDSEKSKTKASACLGADNNVEISEGTLTLTATGSGGKGINCDNEFNFSGGNLNISTSGGMLVYSNGSLNHNYTGNTDRIDSDMKSSPKGVKADGNVTISGGEIYVKTTGNGAEGIESKSELTVEDGKITIRAKDDGINSSDNMYIKGGILDVISTSNDGLDSNKNLYISDGVTMAYGASGAECGLDANDEQGYSVYFTGGYILAAGGRNSVPKNSNSTQPYITANFTLTAGSEVSVGSGDKTLYTFTIPSDYGSSSNGSRAGGGPGGNSSGNLLISAEGMISGSSYTIKSGSSSTTATAK